VSRLCPDGKYVVTRAGNGAARVWTPIREEVSVWRTRATPSTPPLSVRTENMCHGSQDNSARVGRMANGTPKVVKTLSESSESFPAAFSRMEITF